MRIVSFLLCLALTGCASSSRLWPHIEDFPASGAAVELWSRPAASAEAQAGYLAARRLAGLGRIAEAVEQLEAVLRVDPDFLEARRRIQDLLHGTVADWKLRRMFPEVAAPFGSDGDTLYLRARIEPDQERQTALFEMALRKDPGHPYARVGRALSLERAGDLEGAIEEARTSAASAPWLSLPWMFLGQLMLARGEPGIAERFFFDARDRDPVDPRPWLGIASAAQQAGRAADASRAAVEAFRRAPGDVAVVGAAVAALETLTVPADLREAVEIAETSLALVAEPASLHQVRARLLLALGSPAEAVRELERAVAKGLPPADGATLLRRARVAAGGYSKAVHEALEALPHGVRTADNLLGPRWDRLFAAATELAARDTPDVESLRALAGAMRAVGWSEEAMTVMNHALALDPGSVELQTWVAGELAFGRFLNDLVVVAQEARLALRREAGGPSLEALLARVRDASLRRLGSDVTVGHVVRGYPLVGSFTASVTSSGDFQRVFSDRGLFLLVGERFGRPAELALGRLVAVRSGARATVRGRDLDFDECWIESEGLPPDLSGLRGGLAGLTLDRLVFIQLDAVRRGPVRIHRGLELELRPVLDDGDRIALDTPSEVAARIEGVLEREGVLIDALLDAVRRHELVHVLDARNLLPLHHHPLAALSFAFSNRFSAARAERTLEARAAALCIAESRWPRAALSGVLSFLPDVHGRASAHPAAYADVCEALVEELVADPEAFPSIDPAFNVVQQMDRLTDEEARELGRRVAERF